MATATEQMADTMPSIPDEAPVSEVPVSPKRMSEIDGLRAELALVRLELANKADDDTRIRESRRKVRQLEVKALEAAKASSAAKKAYEAALDDHLALEDEIDSGQARLPLKVDEEAVEAVQDEAWRDVWIEDLGLPSGIVQTLNDGGLQTLGELADYTKADKRLTDIEGIGAVKAEKIEDALNRFWEGRMSSRPELDTNQELLDGVREAEAS